MFVFAPNSFAIENGIIWFVPFSDRVLCGYSIEKKEFVIVREIPEEDNKVGKYRNIIVSNNKVYLIPSSSKYLCIYELDKDSFIKIKVSENEYNNKFFAAAVYGNNIYIFPEKEREILKVDLQNNNVKKISIPELYLQKNGMLRNFGLSYCKLENKIILPSFEKKTIDMF